MATMFDLLELDGLPSTSDTIGVPGSGADVEFLMSETTATVPDDYYSDALAEVIEAGFHIGSNGTFPAEIDSISYSMTGLYSVNYDIGGTSYSGFVAEATPVGGGTPRYFFLPEDGTDISINQLTITLMTSVVFIDADDAAIDDDITFIVCFAAGTRLASPTGPKAVEELAEGDLVDTLDNGPLPILWTSQTQVSVGEQSRDLRLQAIEIDKGAFAEDVPRRRLKVSRQHRIMVKSKIARRMFGSEEVLVAAKDLLGLPGVHLLPPNDEITYVHLLLPCHSVLQAEGAWAESLWLGDEAVRMMGAQAAREAHQKLYAGQSPARLFVSGSRARRLVSRHLCNRRPLLGNVLSSGRLATV